MKGIFFTDSRERLVAYSDKVRASEVYSPLRYGESLWLEDD